MGKVIKEVKCNRCGKKGKLQAYYSDNLYIGESSYTILLCDKCYIKLCNEVRKKEKFFRGDDRIKKAVTEILDVFGLDKKDENFRNTPTRVSRMYMEMFEGLNSKEEVKEILRTKFPSTYEGMVISKDINVYSMCPHHLLPVKYEIHVGILFNKECIGLSKIPRLVELLAKRPVLQETLTQEITHLIDKNLKTLGSICIINGVHSCMQARGVKATGTSIITSSVTGKFLNPDKHKNPKEEFLKVISNGN